MAASSPALALPAHNPDRRDLWIALAVGLAALAVYVRTLAPDLLYGDSAEFQALSYTLGIAHSTGYPVNNLLGKLLGSLLPFGTFAYRINLLSAIYASGALSFVYLLARKITRSRGGAVLAAVVLGLGHTYWSQSIIAEVYALAALAIVSSLFCFWHWQDQPTARPAWLAAALLIAGFGIHTVVVLTAPALGLGLLLTLWRKHLPRREWLRAIGAALAGGAAGAAVFFLSFYLSDTLINPPTSFLNVSLLPSHSLWGATTADLDQFFERVYHTVVSLQWRNQLFSGDPAYMLKSLGNYADALFQRDFSWLALLLTLLGLVVLFIRQWRMGILWLVAYATLLFYILNYQVSSKYVFYLATYLLISVLAGAGAGFLLEKLGALLGGRAPRLGWLVACTAALLLAAAAYPRLAPTWNSLAAGKAVFYTDDEYAYPYKNLTEPRASAEALLASVPDDAVLLVGWRILYAAAYLANAEQNRPGITFREASPHPSRNKLTDSLVQEVTEFLKAGRPVYADNNYENLRQYFQTRPAANRLIQVTLK